MPITKRPGTAACQSMLEWENTKECPEPAQYRRKRDGLERRYAMPVRQHSNHDQAQSRGKKLRNYRKEQKRLASLPVDGGERLLTPACRSRKAILSEQKTARNSRDKPTYPGAWLKPIMFCLINQVALEQLARC